MEINNILSDLITLYFAILGILFGIFTVLWSFILSKRDELLVALEDLRQNNKRPLLVKKVSLLKSYICHLKKVNAWCVSDILGTLFMLSACWVSLRFTHDYCQEICFWIIVGLSAICIVGLMIQSVFLWINYKNCSKI